jgi:hypothetical protein
MFTGNLISTVSVSQIFDLDTSAALKIKSDKNIEKIFEKDVSLVLIFLLREKYLTIS